MKKTTKIISVVIALAFLFTALAGCAGSSTAQPSTSSTTEKPVASEEKATIHFAYWVAENDAESLSKFKKATDNFTQENPNINVVLDAQGTSKSDDYAKKYDMLLLSGDKTDIICTKSVADYVQKAKRNLFLPMDEFMAKDNLKTSDYLVDTTQSGKVYGLPWITSSSLVLINKKYMDEAGLKTPPLDWTWDDYKDYAMKMTKGDGKTKRYGSIVPFWGDPVYFYIGVTQTKADNPLFKDEKTHNFSDPVLKDYLKLRYDMENVDKSEVSNLEYTASQLNYMSEFFKGNAAMVCTGSFAFGGITNLNQNPHDFQTVVAMSPRWKDSSKGWERGDATIASINKNIDSKNKEAAYKFIKYLSQKGVIATENIPAFKGADANEIITNITKGGNEKLFDIPSLTAYYQNKDRHENVAVTVPEKDAQMKAILKEETEKYLAKTQTLDQAIEAMIKRADDEMKK